MEFATQAQCVEAHIRLGRVSKIATGFTRLWLFLLAMLLATRTTAAEEIQLRTRGGTFSVEARLKDAMSLNFVLDTGATNGGHPCGCCLHPPSHGHAYGARFYRSHHICDG